MTQRDNPLHESGKNIDANKIAKNTQKCLHEERKALQKTLKNDITPGCSAVLIKIQEVAG